MEISNKTLAWLVVVAIVVSLFGTIISLNKLNKTSELTGFAVSNTTGTAQVAISSQTVLRFVVSSVDFGTGQINTTASEYNCTLSVNDSTTGTVTKSAGCIGFNNAVGSAFTLQNAGTTYLNVSLNFSSNASTFIGGTTPAPSFQFQMANNGSGNSCVYSAGLNYTGWTEVNSSKNYNVCQNMSYYGNNSFMMGIRVVIPSDAQGSKSVSIIAQGTG